MNGATVYLVDDEAAVLKALGRLLRTQGFTVRAFTSASAFLAEPQSAGPACLILDVAMPEQDGLEVQRQLATDGIALPIVFLTGKGDIPMSVRAIKAGATDFLTKPVNADDLFRAVRAALQKAEGDRQATANLEELGARLARLTPREREVLEHVIAGKLNKQIAADLGTGEQTVKVHRRRVMDKMEVASVAELVRLTERLGLAPAP